MHTFSRNIIILSLGFLLSSCGVMGSKIPPNDGSIVNNNPAEMKTSISTGSLQMTLENKDATSECQSYTEQQFSTHTSTGIYKDLIAIGDNSGAKNDWAIMKGLAYKQCDNKNLRDDVDKKLCELYSSGDIDNIKKLNLIPEEFHTIQSLITGKKYCDENEAICIFDVQFIKNLKEKNLPFPNDLNEPKISFYGYKQLYPDQYQANLKKLFLDACEKK